MGEFLNYSLKSILNQTYKNLEIIIVDDGSTDLSLDIIKSFGDQRIKLIQSEHKGRSSALNKGLENATGQYVHFFDLDDYIPLNFYEVLFSQLDLEAECIITGHKIVDSFKEDLLLNPLPVYSILGRRNILREFFCGEIITTAQWNKIYRTDFVKRIALPDSVYNDDLFITPQRILELNRIQININVCYNHLFRIGSMSRKKPSYNFLFENVSFRNLIYDKFTEYFSEDSYTKSCFLRHAIPSMIYNLLMLYSNDSFDENVQLEFLKLKSIYKSNKHTLKTTNILKFKIFTGFIVLNLTHIDSLFLKRIVSKLLKIYNPYNKTLRRI
jgi:glycosyltransferase involved in cell wall biosynthesis